MPCTFWRLCIQLLPWMHKLCALFWSWKMFLYEKTYLKYSKFIEEIKWKQTYSLWTFMFQCEARAQTKFWESQLSSVCTVVSLTDLFSAALVVTAKMCICTILSYVLVENQIFVSNWPAETSENPLSTIELCAVLCAILCMCIVIQFTTPTTSNLICWNVSLTWL